MKRKAKIATNPYGQHPPDPIRTESGCKVGWCYYDNLESAELASRWAREQAKIVASIGYDFGYCTPGAVSPINGLWRVCVP